MAPWAAGPGALRHIRVCRARAPSAESSDACALLRRAGFFAPHTACVPQPPGVAGKPGRRSSCSLRGGGAKKIKSAALEEYVVVGSVAAHRLRRSDDVRAPPASISVCPPSSALLSGLRRGVAVVNRSACGAIGGGTARVAVFSCTPCIGGGAGERWSFVVRSVDRAARPKRRREAHDRSPVPARDRLPRCSAPRHVSMPTVLPA